MHVATHTRPLHRRWAAAVLAPLVAAAGVALAAAQPVDAAPVAVTGGHIEWGVKQSFRSYITGPIAHGSISLASSVSGVAPINRAPAVNVPVRTQSDQAVLGADVYRFGVLPGGTSDASSRDASVESGGVVRFQGHDGLLDLTLDHLRVELDGSTGTVVADVTSKPLSGDPAVLYDDVELADLDLSGVTPTSAGGTTTYAGIPAALTAEGAEAFAGFYFAGDALDPITLVLREATPAPAPVVGRAVDAGAVRWTVSRQVWGQTSLNQCLEGLDGASISGTPSDASFADPANGITFPVASGAYDEVTGATQLDLDGTAVIGNRAQGNYRIKLADPTLTIDAAGNGTLTADVSYSLPPGGPPPATCDLTGRTFVPGGDDVVIATFNGTLADGPEVTGDFTPHFAENVFSIDPRFTSVLDPSLRGHFSVSNGNPNTSGTPSVEASHRKALQPVRVAFSVVQPVPTTVALSPASAAATTGAQHCVTATVADQDAAPLAGTPVSFTVAGANPGSGSGTTDGAGSAQHCWTGSAEGTDTVTATAGDASGSATVSWTAPTPPPPPAQDPISALLSGILALVQSLLSGLGL